MTTPVPFLFIASPSDGSAYNACQSNDSIHDGDVIHVPNEGVVGLAGTWSAAVTKNYGQLHAYAVMFTKSQHPRRPKKDQTTQDDGGISSRFLSSLRQHGYETVPIQGRPSPVCR